MSARITQEIEEEPKTFIKDYLAGAIHDGSLIKGYHVKYFQKYKPWLTQVIKPCLKKAYSITFRPKVLYWDKTKWVLHFRHQKVWKDLFHRRQRKIPTLKHEMVIAYIRGFWDADGGCPRHPTPHRKLYIDFTQKNKTRLEAVKTVLNRLNIRTGNVRISEHKTTGNIHRIAITGKAAMRKFVDSIGSWHPNKRQRLDQLRNLLITT